MSDFRQPGYTRTCDAAPVHEDFDRCYRAVQSKDARFDGWFVTAVLTTKIYCRPSCPVRPPFATNIRFYPTAAAAQHAGFRACKRCRPDASPGSPEWNVRGDVVARAMRLIADGTVDRDGVTGLAARLGYSTRQLERLLQAEVGANPLALARAQRAQTARVLIETTDLPFAEVAFAAGFSSIRQFNDTVRLVFDGTPTSLRARAVTAAARRGAPVTAPGTLALRLPVRAPFAYEGLFGHLAASAVPGCEEVRDGAYRRTLRLPTGNGIVSLAPMPDHVRCLLVLDDVRDLPTAIARCRRLLDLDADPEAVVDALSADPDLAPLVTKAPGQRIPRTVDEAELAVRVVLGQQVSVAAARTHAARLVARHGRPVPDAGGGLTHVFPAVEDLATLDPGDLAFPKGAPARPDGAHRRPGRRHRRPGRGRRLGPGPAAARRAPGHRAVDFRSDRHAGPRRSGCLPRHRPGRAQRRGPPRAAEQRRRARRAQRPLAPVALVRCAAPLGRARPPDQPLATQGAPMTVTITCRTIDSPVGPLTLAGRGPTLTNLRMVDQSHEPSRAGWEPDGTAFPDAVEQLDAYFASERTDFALELDLVGTEFQRRVWAALCTIPYGETRSYGEIADQIGSPGAFRAVGLANGRNPIGIIVPCHRVIGASGSLTGYGGGLDRKRALLDLEQGHAAPRLALFG